MKKLLLLFAITWLPLAAWCDDGDTFMDNTVEGVAITFMVTSEANKQCQVGTDNWNSPAVNSSTTGTLTIPSNVNGYSVVSIGGQAFRDCIGLTSVTIPSSVESIGFAAFCGCSGLTYVNIPKSVTYISGWTFLGCRSLPKIVIPDNVTYIGESAFQECSGLTSINIPDNVTNNFQYFGVFNNRA